MEKLKHVAIIMDGNGRWATKRGLNRSMGHREGSKTLEKLCLHIADNYQDISHLSVFAFSTENFKRSKEEVDFLMNLFIEMFHKQFKTLQKKGVKVVFSGRREPLRQDVLDSMNEIVQKTKDNTELTLNICLNYGGHTEMVDTTKKICEEVVKGNLAIEDINEGIFEENLYQNLPPIDLLIRTSGEYRISNFMLWQMSYSEFYFTDTLFPDFKEQEFDKAVNDYYQRDRKFGGVKS